MTDEQIKQNAWKDLGRYTPCDENEWIDGYVVGAHSRDEEIEELQNELESLRKGFYERGDKLKELMLKNNKLRNPWISVEEQLPKEIETENYKNTINEKYEISKDVFVVDKCGNIGVGCYDHTRKFWLLPYYFRSDAEIVRWMPIPQIEKGE